jgi:hypothetical protein
MIPALLFSLWKVMRYASFQPTVDDAVMQLPAGKEWTMARYGFDENENGVVDDVENNMHACNRNDTDVFKTNGPGYNDDHSLPRRNGVAELAFQRRFIDHQTINHCLPVSYASI